jgi:hypothetical protein
MGLTMGQRKAVTKAIATRYKRAGKPDKSKILDELCATTGWHRNHARKALAAALRPTVVRSARRPRPAVYGPDVLLTLRLCWAVLAAPTGKRLAPVMTELVSTLWRFGELDHLWPDSEDRTREAIDAVLGAPADSPRTDGAVER